MTVINSNAKANSTAVCHTECLTFDEEETAVLSHSSECACNDQPHVIRV